MRETRDRFDRRDACEVERALGFGERAKCVFQYSGKELLLATEVVIEHAFVGFRAAGNLIDACAEQSTIRELLGRREQNTATGAFRISFDFRLIHGGNVLREPRIPDHTASFMAGLPGRSGMAALRGLVGGKHRPAVIRKALRLWHMVW